MLSRFLPRLLVAGSVAACGDAGSGLPPGFDPGPEVFLSRLPGARTPFSDQSALHDPARLVIRTPEDWAARWADITSFRLPPPPVPTIDFTREMILLVALGERSTSGYLVVVERVFEAADGGLDVVVRKERYGSGCIVAAVVTAPVDLAMVPRREGAVRFWEREQVRNC